MSHVRWHRGVLAHLDRENFPERHVAATKYLALRRAEAATPEAVEARRKTSLQARRKLMKLLPAGLGGGILLLYLLLFPPWSGLGHCVGFGSFELCRSQDGEWMTGAEHERRWDVMSDIDNGSIGATPVESALGHLRRDIEKHLGERAQFIGVNYIEGSGDGEMTVEIGNPDPSVLAREGDALIRLIEHARKKSRPLSALRDVRIRFGTQEGFALAPGYTELTRRLE